MDLIAQVEQIAGDLGASLKQNKKGVYTLEWLAAERKTFIFRKKVIYIAKFRLDDEARELVFSEMLKESGAGMSSGDDFGPGAGFKKETYKTGAGPREGAFEEQARLLGEKYKVRFDWGSVRGKFEQAADAAGWKFTYKVNPWGV